MTSKKGQGILMFALCVVGIAALSSCSQSRSHQKVVLDIPARTMWVDTGLDVTNKTIQIKYESGTWSNDGAESHFCDGEGFIPESQDFRDVMPKLLVTNAPLGALIGRTNGEPFFVGNTYEDRPGEGHLYLCINDMPDSFDDNAGSLRIAVSVLD
ncbi:MAG: hypothetical protein AABN34_00100 [Acidobacteriota bacterium]